MCEVSYQVFDQLGNPIPRYSDRFVQKAAMLRKVPASQMHQDLSSGKVDLWSGLDIYGCEAEVLGSEKEIEKFFPTITNYTLADLGKVEDTMDGVIVLPEL